MRRNIRAMLAAMSALAFGSSQGNTITISPMHHGSIHLGLSAIGNEPLVQKSNGKGTKAAKRKAQKARNRKKSRRKKK